jgi:hypothetical protein
VRKIVVRGLELDVEFRFFPVIPATKDEPASPEEICVETVMLDEYDITHMIGPKAWAEVEQEILKLWDEKGSV